MTLLNKILITITVLVIVASGLFIWYKEKQMNDMQNSINASLVAQKTLIDGITRSSSSYATKGDLENMAQQQNVNLAAIQKDLDKLNATVSGMNVIVVNSQGENQTNIPSTSTSPDPNAPNNPTVNCNGQQISCPPADIYGYTKNTQMLDLNEQFSDNSQVGIGQVSFSAAQKAPWSVNIYPRSYSVSNTIGTDQNGKQYVYNKFSITSNGKTVVVPISSATFEQEVPKPTFSFWNPRLFLMANGIANVSAPLRGDFTPGVGLQIMSYGSSKITPSISVLQIGAGYSVVSQKGAVVINPVSFNMGGVIPGHIIDNTFIGPSVQMDAGGSFGIGAGISVGF